MNIIKINETYVINNAPYESHRRGKNYASKITGLNVKYIFARTFLNKGGEHGQYILTEKPSAGEIFEIQAIYRSGSGSPSVREESGFYELQSDGTFQLRTKEEVKAKFQVHDNITETF
jgi:acyl-CoA-binding protein